MKHGLKACMCVDAVPPGVSVTLTGRRQAVSAHPDEPLLPLGRGRRALGVPGLRLPLAAGGHAGAGGARGLPGVRPGLGLRQRLRQPGGVRQAAGLRRLVVSTSSTWGKG